MLAGLERVLHIQFIVTRNGAHKSKAKPCAAGFSLLIEAVEKTCGVETSKEQKTTING